MIRLLFLVAVLFGSLYLIRWFLKTPAETVAASIKKSLWLALGLGLIILALIGKLNIIFALIGSAIPIITKHLPNALRVFGFVKSIQSAKEKTNHSPPPSAPAHVMSTKEALDILGLSAGASKKEIITAHKRLMQKNHPDKGGSQHLATQINHAKTSLLKNHEQ